MASRQRSVHFTDTLSPQPQWSCHIRINHQVTDYWSAVLIIRQNPGLGPMYNFHHLPPTLEPYLTLVFITEKSLNLHIFTSFAYFLFPPCIWLYSIWTSTEILPIVLGDGFHLKRRTFQIKQKRKKKSCVTSNRFSFWSWVAIKGRTSIFL